ncbi:hypothetical protein LG634_00960 [Streptomyces bambusae]|uniref:hypothetical protein n=1 Tax=Streptomyces bambusae TaxID=1550616 RepID=UPI001CFD123F|nr:hypothetical protein [Streptomyces bambusae]MCB5163423.1 hypothetical protein [Streptomyces bambusae]
MTGRRTARRGPWRIAVAALTAVCAVLFGMTASAGAADGSAVDRFGAQARKAGLSAAQAEALQARLDGYLAKAGGRQTAANEITYEGNGTLVLALPGERKARSLNPAAPTALAGCSYYWFCTFSGPEFTGDSRSAERCNTNTYIPWTTTNGSWINNQTGGTRAKLKNQSYTILSWTAGAYSEQRWGVNWGPIHYIDPC